MEAFKVFDRANKITWTIIHFHPTPEGGFYLAAREDETNKDGQLCMMKASDLMTYRMVGFVRDVESC